MILVLFKRLVLFLLRLILSKTRTQRIFSKPSSQLCAREKLKCEFYKDMKPEFFFFLKRNRLLNLRHFSCKLLCVVELIAGTW